VRRTVPPSAEIEEQIDRLLAVGVGENPREWLSELAKLGARLIIQRAVEEEFDAWLGRARYERRPEASPGLRNGFRPRRVQTAEGELRVELAQVRRAAGPLVSKLFARGTRLLGTEALRAMVIGAFVRGLSMREVESLCEQAGLGRLSKSTASRIGTELRERFAAFGRRDLYDIQLAALFLDAVFLSVRPDGPKEGVLVAWGFTEGGERVLLAVMLGMRESHEDWLALGRDLIARGLGAPMLIVADGAPGLIKAVEQCWPASDRQHCAVHRVGNLLAKLPERSANASGAPTGRRSMTPPTSGTQSRDRKPWSTSSTEPATPPRPSVWPTTSTRSSSTCAPGQTPPAVAINEPAGAIARRGQAPHQGHRPLPSQDQLPDARLGRARPLHHPRHQRHQVHPARTPAPAPPQTPRDMTHPPPRR
jgi:transposase-like protein